MSVFRRRFNYYSARRPFVPSVVPTPLTGALAVTLDAVTLSAAGTLPIVGVASVTLGAVTLSAAGTAALTGALSVTLGAVTLSAAGTLPIVGVASVTLGAVTLSSVGTLPIVGTLTVTLDAVTLSAAGGGQREGTLAVTLGAVTISAAGYHQIVGTLAVTLGAVTLSASAGLVWSWALEAYISGAWVDISPDVMSHDSPIIAERGIDGNSITNRVAGSGILTCALDNGESNSAGLIGYYSFNHANARANFVRDVKLRLKFTVNGSTTVKWRGYLDDLDPLPGRFKKRTSYLSASDYMTKLVKDKLDGIPVQENQRPDQLINTVLANVPVAPASASIATDPLILPLALHSEQDEKSTPMSVIQKICQTALGYVWVEGDEVLVYQREQTRFTQASAYTFDNTMSEIEIDSNADRIKNKLIGAIFPSRVDTDADTLLASLSSEFALDAGASLNIKMRVRDPAGTSQRISGKDFITTLVADTHYKMSAFSESGGSDMNAYLTITVDANGNTVTVSVGNTGSVRGHISQIDIFGNGIYMYDPIDITVESGSGDKVLNYDFYYLSSAGVARDYLTALHKRTSVDRPDVKKVIWYPDFSLAMMQAAMSLDIGDRVTLQEHVTGLDGDYTINKVRYEITTTGRLKVEFEPEWCVDSYTFWTVQDPVLGEIDATYVLSPF